MASWKLRKLVVSFRVFGIDLPRMFVSLRNFPRFTADLVSWIKLKKSIDFRVSPIFSDFDDSAGSADGHYFWQDLLCAQWIYAHSPDSHLDVASRIDGFVAHVASFMRISVIDIRPLQSNIPNVQFLQMNLQADIPKDFRKFHSVSSLHAIEHFGLGRYGDSLSLDGHVKGLRNIAKLVANGGYLYVSFPIGIPCEMFNEQRIMHPEWPIDVLNDFTLEKFVLIPWKGEPRFNCQPSEVDIRIKGQAGLYCFKKKPLQAT